MLPGVYQLINGQAKLGNLRNVEIEDLLGREPVCFALYEVADYIKGKTVLITGGSGSIGSELCRQIAGYGPSCLVLLDVCENSLYDLQQEVKQTYPNQNFVFLVGSVRDNDCINAVLSATGRKSSSTPRPTSMCRLWRTARTKPLKTTFRHADRRQGRGPLERRRSSCSSPPTRP